MYAPKSLKKSLFLNFDAFKSKFKRVVSEVKKNTVTHNNGLTKKTR